MLLLASLLAILSLSTGCLSTATIGPAVYDGSSLRVQVTNSAGAGDAALQVNVFRFQDFRQVEVTREILSVRLERGTGTYSIPLALDDGTFRLYLYVITNNVRRAAAIQDITVASHGTTPRIGSG
ncbi:MAG: hypothetical protein ACM3X8_01890 [Methanomicrobiales archaeon]